MDESQTESGHRPNLFARLRSSSLFRRDVPATNVRDVIGWWEARRVQFNLIVGITGVISGFLMLFTSLAVSILISVDFGIPDPPFFALIAVLVYAVMANVCYTAGWIVEAFIRKFWPHEADRFATSSFFLGLAFSVLLTLTPGILVVAAGLFGLAHHILRVTHKL